jgi:hypothetical protein
VIELRELELHDLTDAGEPDVLLVTAKAGEGEDERIYSARGWVSSLTSHLDEQAYADVEHSGGEVHEGFAVPGRHRRDDAQPRPMSSQEARAYAESLLRAQNPELAGGRQGEPHPRARSLSDEFLREDS